jgi:hypothetical protein
LKRKRVVGLICTALLLGVLFVLIAAAPGKIDFRLSRRGWDISTGVHILNSTPDLKGGQVGRYFQVGPFICDYFYSDTTMVQPGATNQIKEHATNALPEQQPRSGVRH